MRKLDLIKISVRSFLITHPITVCISILVLCALLMPGLVMFVLVFCAVYYAVTKLMVIAVSRGVL